MTPGRPFIPAIPPPTQVDFQEGCLPPPRLIFGEGRIAMQRSWLARRIIEHVEP